MDDDNTLDINIVGLLNARRDGDDFVMAQTDGHGDSNPESPNAPRTMAFQQYHPYGFSGMPVDATKAGQCQALQISLGYDDAVIALDDPRVTAKLPPIAQGEAMMYGHRGQFVRCRRDGSIGLFTTTTGEVDDRDAQSVFFNIQPDGFRQSAPWGRVVFDSTGWHTMHSSGAEIHAGYISGLPAPFGSLTTYVDIVGGTVRIKTAMLDIGQNPLLKDHLAHATPIVMILQEVVKSLAYCSTAPGVNPLISESLTTLTTYLAAMVAEGTLPSSLPKLRSIVVAD